ncbi:MAG TPA: ATP-binding protein [Candidatus Acidoferrales bacterium]|nr:ATP-binding protein [Candidatus Acidoferrales bacterium]
MGDETPNPLSISRIEVDRLFGQFTYNLQSGGVDLSKLLILYGDNGSGKTTILNCIFHLLSPAANRGHRGELARVPFARFSVTLGDGTTVSAERPTAALVGNFDMSLHRSSREKISRSFEFDADFKAKQAKTDQAGPRFLPALASLGLRLHLLSDERKIVTDMAPSGESDEGDTPRRYFVAGGNVISSRRAPNYLEQAIQRAVEGIRRQAIAGSGAGEINANTLYADITKRIVSPFHRGTVRGAPSLTELVDDLKRQAERSVSFARFGLSSELRADDFLGTLHSTRAQDQAEVLEQILRPFIDGFKLRLDALESLHDKISTFIGTLNAFYRGKTVSFHLREGFLVTSQNGELLPPNVLSSGEKQLLLLFCNILAVGEEASIFIIDEPELSLNVKWQRKLVDALLDCTKNTRTQFILATHSIELLTQHQHNVLQLATQVPE